MINDPTIKQYIYIMLFESGVIKIGRSMNPICRMHTHERERSKANDKEKAHLFFLCTGHAGLTERSIFKNCAAISDNNASEWFYGLNYESALKIVESECVINHSYIKTENDCCETMTPTKLMWYYKQNKSLAARDIGCSRATISNWIKAKKIPKRWQLFIALHWELGGKK